MSYADIEDFSVYQTWKWKILGPLISTAQRLGIPISPLQTGLWMYIHKHPVWSLFSSHIHTVIQTQTCSVENSHTNSYTKNSENTYTTHTPAHLFEDPTNLSNSALGMLLMGDRGRGWWKCLRPGRIDRLAAPNERQACLRNHEGRAVGLQQRS